MSLLDHAGMHHTALPWNDTQEDEILDAARPSLSHAGQTGQAIRQLAADLDQGSRMFLIMLSGV